MTELQKMALSRISHLAGSMKIPAGFNPDPSIKNDTHEMSIYNEKLRQQWTEADEARREITNWTSALLKENP